MKKAFYIITSLVVVSCSLMRHRKDLLFYSIKNNTVFDNFIESAVSKASMNQDSLMILLSFSKDTNDTLVSMAAVPYPCMLQIDEADSSDLFHQVVFYRDYLVSIYDYYGGGLCHSLIRFPSEDNYADVLQNDVTNQPPRDPLRGFIELYHIHNGILTLLEKTSSVTYYDDEKEWWTEETLEDIH